MHSTSLSHPPLSISHSLTSAQIYVEKRQLLFGLSMTFARVRFEFHYHHVSRNMSQSNVIFYQINQSRERGSAKGSVSQISLFSTCSRHFSNSLPYLFSRSGVRDSDTSRDGSSVSKWTSITGVTRIFVDTFGKN